MMMEEDMLRQEHHTEVADEDVDHDRMTVRRTEPYTAETVVDETNELHKDVERERMEDDQHQMQENRRQAEQQHKRTACLQSLRLVASASEEFRRSKCSNNFTKGCKWAPDGTCLLVSAEDKVLRLFELPTNLYKGDVWKDASNLEMSVATREPGTIYDYCWCPNMNSSNAETCWFLSTAQSVPIHLWDCFSGTLKATYRAYNNVDEVHAARSIAVDPAVQKIYAGFINEIKVFDVNRPGRDFKTLKMQEVTIAQKRATRLSVVSSIVFNAASPKIFAAGTYCKKICLFTSEPESQPICRLEGQTGGITHLKFSADGMKLFSGARRDDEIIAWDLRWPGNILFSLKRNSDTTQRIYFDVDPKDRFLASGSTDGSLLMWNLDNPDTPLDDERLTGHQSLPLHQDCINGVSIHPFLPLLATNSGQRHYAEPMSDSESEEFFATDKVVMENSVKLWWYGT